MRDSAAFGFIVQLMRQKFRFLLVLVLVGGAGIVAAHGWSWTTAIFVLIAAIVLPLFYALMSFWIWVFSNTGRRGEQQ